ncbi:MAG: tRNA (adenosine(37)-N6)-threonylcarbamoyltransferase complex ATPase subunit type 1 TsaE [Patescibacteria group bacterium]
MKKIITHNQQETTALGFEIGKACLGGEVFALSGDLGAGKTTFLQGLAKGLGVKIQVNSPTFNILKLYKTKAGSKVKEFCHIDSYRLTSGKDLENLGIKEFLDSSITVTAIEWAEKVKKVLPKKIISISISHLTENKREIKIKKG